VKTLHALHIEHSRQFSIQGNMKELSKSAPLRTFRPQLARV